MLEDQENSILTAQKAIDLLIIYSIFTSNLALPAEFLYKFELMKWLHDLIYDVLVSWKMFVHETVNFDSWIANHKLLIQTLGDVLLVWVKYMVKYIHICMFLMHDSSWGN